MNTLEYLLGEAAKYGLPVPPYPQPPMQNKYIVTADELNVRSGPAVTYSRLEYLSADDEVTAMREQNGWAEIAPGQWVSMAYLRKVIY